MLSLAANWHGTEEALRQGGKLQAIGPLTVDIAHDFNRRGASRRICSRLGEARHD